MFPLPGARLRPTLRSLHRLSNCTKPSTTRLQLTRNYSPYPKEGVFQPNSPPHPGLNPQQYNQAPPPPPPPQEEARSAALGGYLKVAIDALVATSGFGLAWMFVENLSEIRFPPLLDAEPGSAEDTMAIQELYDDLNEIRGVQDLRREVVEEEDGRRVPAWREWVAYNGFTDEDRRALRLTTGPLGGYNGVAAQFVFWCERTKELCVFIHFGPKTCGWPGVVHGGAIATILDESLGRNAILTVEERTTVTAQLTIDYMDKIEPGVWYMVHVKPDTTKMSTEKKKFLAGSIVCISDDGPYRDGRGGWDGQIHLHCKAEGLFVVPKQAALSPVPDEF